MLQPPALRALLFSLVIIIALLAAPFYLSTYLVAFLIILLGNVALAESWNAFSGLTGYVLLGEAAFFGVGAYIPAYLPFLPYYASVLVGGSAAAGVAALLSVSLRVRGPYFVILTFAITEVIRELLIYYEINTFHTLGRILVTQDINTIFYVISLIALFSIFGTYLVKRSRFGLGLSAIKEDEDAAECRGVNTTLYKLLAFMFCAFIGGMVGAATVVRSGYIDPNGVFAPAISFQALIMVYLGGVSTIMGPVVGAVVLSVLSEVLQGNYPYQFTIILGALIIFLVLFLPKGVLGEIKALTERLRARTSK